MLKVECDMCDDELTEPGALMFAPPNEMGVCRKLHLCRKCWSAMMARCFHVQTSRK